MGQDFKGVPVTLLVDVDSQGLIYFTISGLKNRMYLNP